MILDELNALTAHHVSCCKLYADYVHSMFETEQACDLAGVPFLPVRAFKEFELKSIPDDEVYKVMRSSGTSGQFSKIYLDRKTAQTQTRALVDIFCDTFGKGRFPMLVIDAESTVKDRLSFSARTGAINGFSMFSRGRCFALNDDFELDIERVEGFIEENRGKPIFIFGFTFLIWSAFTAKLKEIGKTLDLGDAFVLHGGGWKKLESQSVSNDDFKAAIAETTGCSDVRNYYGMVEQTGTIFMECPYGHLHAGIQSDVLVRDAYTHQALDHGQEGLIQVFSTIQNSYPGHSLLTEDMGMTMAGTDCACGNAGTIVKISGRLKKAEVRGCSDAYS